MGMMIHRHFGSRSISENENLTKLSDVSHNSEVENDVWGEGQDNTDEAPRRRGRPPRN